MIINYPRNRRQQFTKLFLLVGAFIAGFFWTTRLAFFAHDHLGWDAETVGLPLFIGNVIAIGYGGMAMGYRWKKEISRDFQRVWTFPKITYRDRDWLEANSPPESYTIHATEGRWPQGERKRRPDDLYVEFHNDQDRVLFEIARQR